MDTLIHDHFPCEFPVLHARQQLYIDPIMTDTTASEADFSVQGYLRIKQLTSMSFEERMWWFTHVLGRLRKVGHEHGETSRAARRLAMSQSMDTLEPQRIQVQTDAKLSWCRTHGQCAAIATTIEKEFLPMFTPDKMMDARTVRKGLKIGDGFVANDEARVVSWTEALVVDSDRYLCDVPIDELRKKIARSSLEFRYATRMHRSYPSEASA